MSNTVTMSIAEQGGGCTDVASPFGETFLTPGRVGLIQLIRVSFESTVDRPDDLRGIADFAFTVLTDQIAAGPFFFNYMVSLPPPGTCLAASGRALDVLGFSADRQLAGGDAITVEGPGGARMATLNSADAEVLGGDIPDLGFARPFLLAGNYRISSEGGADVGAIEGDLAVPGLPTWVNRVEVDVVDRSQALRIDWQVASPDDRVVAVLVFGRASAYRTPAAVLCVEQASAGSLTVPPRDLLSLPPSNARAFSDRAFILVGTAPAGAPLKAAGLDGGVAAGIAVVGKEVVLE